MKKVVSLVMAALLCMSALAGCSSTDGTSSTGGSSTTGGSSAAQTEGTGMSGAITVISREEGSGTRGAFVELMGVETDDGDMTTENAEIANSTSLVQNTVSGNKNSIGYISLGSYDSSAVKAVKVDGVEATVENIKAGKYAVSRPFVLCYKEENLTDLGKDFIKFILSAEGQAIVSEEGYITVNDEAESYTASGLTGNLSLNGSTSVGPVMEVLAEAYMGLNNRHDHHQTEESVNNGRNTGHQAHGGIENLIQLFGAEISQINGAENADRNAYHDGSCRYINRTYNKRNNTV